MQEFPDIFVNFINNSQNLLYSNDWIVFRNFTILKWTFRLKVVFPCFLSTYVWCAREDASEGNVDNIRQEGCCCLQTQAANSHLYTEGNSWESLKIAVYPGLWPCLSFSAWQAFKLSNDENNISRGCSELKHIMFLLTSVSHTALLERELNLHKQANRYIYFEQLKYKITKDESHPQFESSVAYITFRVQQSDIT